MALEINHGFVSGNLGKDAVISESGDRVTFSLANTRTFNGRDGQKQKRTSWLRCVWYGERGVKLAPYLTKGRAVVVEYRIEAREYEKNGQKQTITELIVNGVQLLPDRNGEDGGNQRATVAADDGFGSDDNLDDVPF